MRDHFQLIMIGSSLESAFSLRKRLPAPSGLTFPKLQSTIISRSPVDFQQTTTDSNLLGIFHTGRQKKGGALLAEAIAKYCTGSDYVPSSLIVTYGNSLEGGVA